VRACFITIEGTDCAGKSTQARLLAESLAATGRPVLLTREPGGAPGAEALRGFLLANTTKLDPLAEALIHFAARTDHASHTLRPALAAGLTIVCDRFFDSTMAYQGYGQGADRAAITALIRLLDLTPNLTFVLDLPPAEEERRRRQRGTNADRYEQLGPAFLERTRLGFQAIAKTHPERCVLVDASPPPAEVHARLFSLAQARLT
jgi:dTMP kinase